MARAAILLSILALFGVLLNVVVGIGTGLGWWPVLTHFNVAIPATIVILAAWTIVVFYFIGSVAWVSEALAQGRCDAVLETEVQQIRGRALPGAFAAAGALSVTYVLGGAAHSGALPWQIHLSLAVLTTGVHVVAMYRTIIFVGMMLDAQQQVQVVAED